MNYKNISILLLAAKEAYDCGKLTTDDYKNVLSDCKSNLKKLDKKLLDLGVEKVLSDYINS